MKIFVAIPVYDGKLPVETVRCLLDERLLAGGCGDDLRVHFLPACSHPAMGRNQLAAEFLASDCDRLFFLDADVTFALGDILKVARKKADIVGGAYRFKHEKEEYPVGWLPDPEKKGLHWNEEELLEVGTLPGGFLAISRNALETMKEAFPDRAYDHFGRKAHAFFQMPLLNGQPCGEDSFFCLEWRSIGGKVFLDPMLNLTHWDFNRPYPGNIGAWLRSRAS